MRDAHGNLNHWWSNSTLRQYVNRTQCFVRQYSSYDVTQLLPPHQRPGHHMLVRGAGGRRGEENEGGGMRRKERKKERRKERRMRNTCVVD